MRYISESLEIKDLRSENDVLFKDIKIRLGLLIIARKLMRNFEEIATLAYQQPQIIEL